MKRKTARDKAYLEWIRSQPCCVTGSLDLPRVAHHVRLKTGGGVGLKPSDYYCVPLLNDIHQELHQVGEKSFWEGRYMRPDMILFSHMRKYLVENEKFLEMRRAMEQLCHEEFQ